MARGIALIVAAVLLGVVLLKATDSPEPFTAESTDTSTVTGNTDTPDDTTATTTATTVAATHNPAEVTVLVANGAGINGLARRITDQLVPANYVAAVPTETLAPADASMVYFAEGYEADAAAIAAMLTPPPATAPMPDPPPVEDLKGAQVLVVAAADLAAASG
jgi:hypothetical protein